jgi:hypothetical protein
MVNKPLPPLLQKGRRGIRSKKKVVACIGGLGIPIMFVIMLIIGSVPVSNDWADDHGNTVINNKHFYLFLDSTADNPDLDGDFNLTWSWYWSLFADSPKYDFNCSEDDLCQENILYYAIYHSYNLINESHTLIDTNITEYSYEINDFQNGEHYFIVQAIYHNKAKNSNCININVTNNMPQAFILNSTADNPDLDGQFYLNWTESLNVDNYSIYINETLFMGGLTNLSYYLSNLTNGNYSFYIVAFNQYGNESSNTILIEVTNIPKIFILTSTADIPDLDGQFNLNWTESLNADNYSIYVNDSLFIDSLTNLSYYLSNLTDGNYSFYIVAFNQYGNESSNTILIEVTNIPKIFILTSTAEYPEEDNSFFLNWTESLYSNNYSIYQYDSPIYEINGSLILIGDGLMNLSYYLSNLENGTYYYICVAYNPYGNISSNYIEIVIPPFPEMFILSSTADNPDLDGQFYLNWTVSQYADNYSIYVNDSLFIDSLTNLSYYLSNLTNGNYSFYSVAFNQYGNISSNIINITITNLPKSFILTSTADIPDLDGQFNLNWTESLNADNYSIYVNDSLFIDNLTNLSYYLSNLTDGNYSFYIVAFNQYGNLSSNCCFQPIWKFIFKCN